MDLFEHHNRERQLAAASVRCMPPHPARLSAVTAAAKFKIRVCVMCFALAESLLERKKKVEKKGSFDPLGSRGPLGARSGMTQPISQGIRHFVSFTPYMEIDGISHVLPSGATFSSLVAGDP